MESPGEVRIFAEILARATSRNPRARKSRFYAGLNFAKIRLATQHPRILRFKVACILPSHLSVSRGRRSDAFLFCKFTITVASPVAGGREIASSGVYACYAYRRLYSAIMNAHDFTVDRIRRIMHRWM